MAFIPPSSLLSSLRGYRSDFAFNVVRVFRVVRRFSLLRLRRCCASHETIGRCAGVSVRTVIRVLNFLRDQGFISWVSGASKWLCNVIYISAGLMPASYTALRLTASLLPCEPASQSAKTVARVSAWLADRASKAICKLSGRSAVQAEIIAAAREGRLPDLSKFL